MPEPKFEVCTVQEELGYRHSRISSHSNLSEAESAARDLASTPYGGLPVRIYRDHVLIMEVNKDATQPGLF